MITTPRLLIRKFEPQDGNALFEYLSDPGIYRFEPGEPVSLAEAQEIAIKRAHGSDFWAVVLKQDQRLVGHLYFKQTEPLDFMFPDAAPLARFSRGYADTAEPPIATGSDNPFAEEPVEEDGS